MIVEFSQYNIVEWLINKFISGDNYIKIEHVENPNTSNL